MAFTPPVTDYNNYASASLTFYDNKIVVEDSGSMYNSIEVMMDWEHPIMSASAAYVTQNGGDILEIGFGMGISAGYIQSHSILSHTIIENHRQIIPKAIEWANGKSNVTIVSQSWYSVKDSIGKFDGIFMDTFGDNYYSKHFSSSLSTLGKSGTKVTFWNTEGYGEWDGLEIPNTTYQSITGFEIVEDNKYYLTSSYYMPKVSL